MGANASHSVKMGIVRYNVYSLASRNSGDPNVICWHRRTRPAKRHYDLRVNLRRFVVNLETMNNRIRKKQSEVLLVACALFP
jgi:hypothetical protein